MILTCECGGKVNSEAKQCPHCGKPGPFTPPAPPKPDHSRAWVISITITMIGLWALIKWMQ